jgi:small subunit ribosomal protein S20
MAGFADAIAFDGEVCRKFFGETAGIRFGDDWRWGKLRSVRHVERLYASCQWALPTIQSSASRASRWGALYLRSRHSIGGTALANSKSALKRVRVAERQRVRNRTYRSASRTLVRKAESLIIAGDVNAASVAVANALSMLDRTAGKGIIHPNNAARRKSRLMAKYNAMSASS